MTHTLLISIFCPDKTGLIAAITGSLFDLGVNFGDTSFSILGTGAKFTSVCDSLVNASTLESRLRSLPELAGADLKVTPFELSSRQASNAQITHQITLQGADHPGLLAQLTEVLTNFQANIVRLNAERIHAPAGEIHYLIHIAACLPVERANACLASISNTASSLQMHCHWVEV